MSKQKPEKTAATAPQQASTTSETPPTKQEYVKNIFIADTERPLRLPLPDESFGVIVSRVNGPGNTNLYRIMKVMQHDERKNLEDPNSEMVHGTLAWHLRDGEPAPAWAIRNDLENLFETHLLPEELR